MHCIFSSFAFLGGGNEFVGDVLSCESRLDEIGGFWLDGLSKQCHVRWDVTSDGEVLPVRWQLWGGELG